MNAEFVELNIFRGKDSVVDWIIAAIGVIGSVAKKYGRYRPRVEGGLGVGVFDVYQATEGPKTAPIGGFVGENFQRYLAC